VISDGNLDVGFPEDFCTWEGFLTFLEGATNRLKLGKLLQARVEHEAIEVSATEVVVSASVDRQ